MTPPPSQAESREASIVRQFFYCWRHGGKTMQHPIVFLWVYPFMCLHDPELFGREFYKDLHDPEYLALHGL